MASQKAAQIPKILTGVSAVWVLDSNYALQVWTTRSVCSVLKAFPVSKFNSETSFLFQGEFKLDSLFATSLAVHGEVVKNGVLGVYVRFWKRFNFEFKLGPFQLHCRKSPRKSQGNQIMGFSGHVPGICSQRQVCSWNGPKVEIVTIPPTTWK